MTNFKSPEAIKQTCVVFCIIAYLKYVRESCLKACPVAPSQ